MKESHKGLYTELSGKITAARLKDISIEIISRYRKKDHRYLSDMAETIGISSSGADMSSLFAGMIQLYHPDKFNKITADIEEFYTTGNTDALIRMKGVYLVDFKKKKSIPEYDLDFESEYFYEEDDSSFSEYDDEAAEMDDDEEFDDGDDVEELTEDEEYGFIEAVNDLYIGNMEYELSIHDLQNLDGELDLSGFDIDDLAGAEHCVNITIMNLSGNRLVKLHPLAGLVKLESLYLSENSIEDIRSLATLTGLRELDLSFNQIEDISVLAELTSLQYVNLVDNPVKNTGVIDELVRKGVIVIY
ncbi:MAG TPA: leucine-rich repeat domain-containing protein [Spirochaetota bacterium]|nr:leucine-rich repeat domain-containing protein [Spirochaetota bacterium]